MKINNINSTQFFKENDRICFVGDSLTQTGMFHHNILLFHILRFPYQKINVFNCGIGGNKTKDVLQRLENDVFKNKPNVIVLMLGMNDVHIENYNLDKTENYEKQFKILTDKFKKDYEHLIKIFISKNLRLILQTPTIYDQTVELSSENQFGKNQALAICANFVIQLGYKYNLPVIDYYTIMNEINSTYQKKNKLFTIIGEDRIHPGETGHFIMFYKFLEKEKIKAFVSKIVIDKNTGIIFNDLFNCFVDDYKIKKKKLSFTAKEFSLPYPVINEQKNALSYISFTEKFNQEILIIKNLDRKEYVLSIDNIKIGTFSANQLNKGINLSLFENTPQFRQAVKLKNHLSEMWIIEEKLRELKFIEATQDYKSCPDKNNFSYLIKYLNSSFIKNYTNPYFNEVLNKYIKFKPKEKELEKQIVEMKANIYKYAFPEKHHFELTAL